MHFSVTRGASFSVVLNVTDSNNNPINLTNMSARGYVKAFYSDTGVIYNLNPIVLQPYSSGLISVSGSALNTRFLPVGSFVFDIEAYSNDGTSSLPVLAGDFDVNPSTSFYTIDLGNTTGDYSEYNTYTSGAIINNGDT